MLTKNTASQKVRVFAWDVTTGLAKTGDAANITAYISKDFGAVTQLGDTSATEESSTHAKGYYLFDITQTETNADDIAVFGESTTSNIQVVGAPARIRTVPTGFASSVAQTGDAYARLGAPAGASVSADVAAVKSDSAAVKVQTDKMTFTVANQIDANVQYINDALVQGAGTSGNLWRG